MQLGAGGAEVLRDAKVRRKTSCSMASEFETKQDESEPFTINVKMPGPSESTGAARQLGFR